MKGGRMSEDKHKAALAISDELVDLLEKRAPPGEVAFNAALFTLVITIVQYRDAKSLAAAVCARLPALVDQELAAQAERTH
jgi:hypothetical protein